MSKLPLTLSILIKEFPEVANVKLAVLLKLVNECDSSLDSISVTMARANNILDAHGVETVSHGNFFVADYVNQGGSYVHTIVYSYIEKDYYISSWAEVVEDIDNMEVTGTVEDGRDAVRLSRSLSYKELNSTTRTPMLPVLEVVGKNWRDEYTCKLSTLEKSIKELNLTVEYIAKLSSTGELAELQEDMEQFRDQLDQYRSELFVDCTEQF